MKKKEFDQIFKLVRQSKFPMVTSSRFRIVGDRSLGEVAIEIYFSPSFRQIFIQHFKPPIISPVYTLEVVSLEHFSQVMYELAKSIFTKYNPVKYELKLGIIE